MHCHGKNTPRAANIPSEPCLDLVTSPQDRALFMCAHNGIIWKPGVLKGREMLPGDSLPYLSCISLSGSSENCHWQKPFQCLEPEENGSGRDCRGLLFLGHTQICVWDPSFDRPSVTASTVLLPSLCTSSALPILKVSPKIQPKCWHTLKQDSGIFILDWHPPDFY